MAVAIGTAVNWFTNFTVALAFPYILVRGGRGGEGKGGEDGWDSVNSIILSLSLSSPFLPPSPLSHTEIPLPVWHSGVCGDMFCVLVLPLPLPA